MADLGSLQDARCGWATFLAQPVRRTSDTLRRRTAGHGRRWLGGCSALADPAPERLGVEELELWQLDAFGEQPAAAALCDGIHEDPVLVDEPGFDERMRLGDSAGHPDVAALECPD